MDSNENIVIKLTNFINANNIGLELNIPDYMLAEYLFRNLILLKDMISERDEWFGFEKYLRETKKELE